jgi:hypothetical protein
MRESLIEKQREVEKLITEKNSLQLRLETEMSRVILDFFYFGFFFGYQYYFFNKKE